MAKKKPARKSGAKKAAPTKGAKKVVVVQKARRQGLTTAAERFEQVRASFDSAASLGASVAPVRQTVEEQNAHLFLGKQVVIRPEEAAEIFGAAGVKPKPKFWTRFQSATTGRFVSACAAMADKARTFGRRVLRKRAS